MASSEQEKKEKIHVIVRVRPLTREEATARSPWKLSSKSIAPNKSCRPSIPTHTYTFDRIYGTKMRTLDIYNAHIKDIIATTMSGLNGTIMAYGHCRSGKTYTLRGSAEEAGILMMAIQDMFQIVHEESNREFLIRMSYLEVANGELNDLLASKNHKLDIREDAELGVVIAGLREEIVNKSEHVISLLEFAEARRADSTDATNRGFSHTVFRLVIESSTLAQKGDLFDTHERYGYRISVLNLVELAPAAKASGGMNDSSSQEVMQPGKCLMALQSFMSHLSEGDASARDCVPYNGSRLTHILRPSLGGNARTCFICNISPAMVHMDETMEALDFAAKTTKVINCFKVNEVYTGKVLLKRQRKEISELRNKLKELHSLDLEDEILNRRNALLMIELEKEQMSLELFEKTPSSSQGENKEQDQEQRAENITFESESGLDKCLDLPLVDFNDPLQKRNCTDYLGYLSPAQGTQELDLDLQMNCTGLCLGPSVGTKRKRPNNTTAVADKIDLPLQSKAARDVNWMESEGLADRHKPTEMQAMITQENKEQQELQAQVDEHCSNLQRKIAELEAEKALMETRLFEQEVSHVKELEALRYELSVEKSRQNKVGVSQKVVLEASKSRASDGLEVQQDISQERQEDRGERTVKQNTETQSCTSQEAEDQQRISKEKEGQTTPTKKKPSKINKVYQKFNSSQGRSELSSLRKELAVAKETITALEDERNSLWKDLNHMKSKCKEIQRNLEVNNIEEGVAEIKVLNGATSDISESFEYSKVQLLTLRHGKLASDKEVNSMKSELAKLECVVERQSGVLKVLSDNENLLNELASVRAAMKEAAGASELQMSSIQQEYETRLKELDSDNKHWRQEYLQLDEEQTKLRDKLSTTEAEVIRLTQTRDEKLKQDKRPAKTIKARLAEAEAEIVLLNDQLREKTLSEEDQRKVQEELADSRAEVEKLQLEVQEKSRLEEEYNHVLTKLAKSEAVVAKLTAACEEHREVDVEQKNVQLKLVSEIVKLTKSLEEKSGVEEQQKRIQTDLATLQEKIDNLTEEAQEKDVLEKKQCELILRLDTSEKEVSRLTDLLKSKKEESEVYMGEMLERFRISEAELLTLSESLQREVEERQRLEGEHSRDVNDNEKLEAENSTLTESLKQVRQEKEEEHMKDFGTIAGLKAKIKELTKRLLSMTEMKEIIENEHRTSHDAVVKSEAELKRLAESLHQELCRREILEKELRGSQDHSISLEADVKKLNVTLVSLREENVKIEKEHRKDLEVIARSQIKVTSITEDLQQRLEEKESLERELRKALEALACTDAMVSKLSVRLERAKEGTKSLEEELKKGIADRTSIESRVIRLVEQLDEELEEKKRIEEEFEKATAKLAVAEREVACMTETLNQVREEKCLLDRNHNDVLETCTRLKLEIASLSESMMREVQIPEKPKRETSGAFEESSRLSQIEAQKENERKSLELQHATTLDRVATLQDEAAQLRQILARELETRKKLENDHAKVLDQLSMSRAETASLGESLIKAVEDKRSLMTDHSHTLSILSSQKINIDSLSDALEEKSRLEKELQNVQLVLASSGAEIVRLNEELLVKGSLERELTLTQNQLAKATEEARKVHDETWRLEKEQMEVLDRSTSPDAEVLRLSDDLTERTTLAEEFQAVCSELTESKADLTSVRTALREKLGLEESLIKTQIELVDKQGECEKLTKELRINRKMVKEQKKLLRKLMNTQSEVSRLGTDIVATVMEQPIKTQAIERRDAVMTGLAATPKVKQESDTVHARLREKLANTEIEVRRLTSILEEQKKLEGEHARVQFELGKAENEIQTLTAALVETSRINKLWEVFQRKVSDGAISGSYETNSPQLCLEDFLTQLMEREKKLKEQETELQSKVAVFEDDVNLVGKDDKSEYHLRCAECDVFQTLVEQIRKERDEFRQKYIAAKAKLQTLQSVLENQKKDLEVVERNWKNKWQRGERELADLRPKFSKLEEGMGRIVQEKKALEERLSCNEAQIASLRESTRATSKELEITHHKFQLLQSQHQSDVAAFCGELSMKTARTVELEKDLKTLLSHPPPPPPPAPVMQNEFANYVTSPFRTQSWSFAPALQPPLHPPQQQSHHHESHWGIGPYNGQSR